MPELETVEPQKTAGFVSRSRSKYKDKSYMDEQELKELLAQREGEGVQENPEESKDVFLLKRKRKQRYLMRLSVKKKKSFKTRYGDVRRHLATKEKEYNARIKELEDQLSNNKKLVPPKSDEDISNWAKEYPDVAGIVETIAEKKKLKKCLIKLIYRLKNLAKLKKNRHGEQPKMKSEKFIKTLTLYVTLMIFTRWVEEQPKWVQNALYENTDDANLLFVFLIYTRLTMA